MWRNYVVSTLNRIEAKIDLILKQEKLQMATYDDLTKAITDLDASADKIIAALSSVAASGATPEQLDAAIASIQKVTGKLDDAAHAHGM